MFRDRYSTFYPHGILRKVCRRFPDFDGIEVLIESGTFRGKTTRHESRYFREVHTVELNEELFRSNAASFEPYPNIHAYHGDSAATLPKILSRLAEPCVFFLDAHWSGDHSVDWSASEWKGFDVQTSFRGEKWPPDPDQQCPLIDEAAAINAYPHRSVIIVDDWDVAGTQNLKFTGEDWSSITLDRVLGAFDKDRIHARFFMSYKGKTRMIILLNPSRQCVAG
jgi:hypothetical protein